MRAMILAAGRGERLRPLTDTVPKPLVDVGGKPLLQWHVEKLKQAGITEILVNSAWLSEKIVDFLGDGNAFGVHITHSVEGAGGLETAGGIRHALDFFSEGPFVVVNGDTYMDADYAQFLTQLPEDADARLYLVPNPPHHPKGDFALENAGDKALLIKGGDYTFSGAALYRPEIFAPLPEGKMPLRPVFDRLIEQKAAVGVTLLGQWFDAGTLERLKECRDYIIRRPYQGPEA